jgi:hypothetical protein
MRTIEDSIFELRARELSESDWTQLPDVPMDSELKQAWAAYRQEWRDINKQERFPICFKYPIKPTPPQE